VKEGRIKLPEGILCFGLIEWKIRGIVDFMKEILIPSMNAGSLE
jgi:hypothetical protein